MNNRANEWEVPYSSIVWFETMFKSHGNIVQFSRSKDILFSVCRKTPPDTLFILIANTYTFGVADYYQAKAEFPELTCIVLTGDWNAYTPEAKQLTNSEGTGLFIPKELYAAIWKEEPNKHFTKDSKGAPIYHFRPT